MSLPISKERYSPDNFQFNGVEYPKDEYVQYDVNSRILSKFISKIHRINSYDDYYLKVYSFILSNIIPNHSDLASCNMLHEDMEGNPEIIFNIKFKGDVDFQDRNKLHYTILEEICDFCDSSNFSFVFDNITILLTRGDNLDV